MTGTEVIVPLAFFVLIAAIVLIPGYLKSKERRSLQDTLRVAYEKGQPVPPEVIEAMTQDAKKVGTPVGDIRKGLILMAVAGALVTMGYLVGYEAEDAYYPMMGAAAFPGFIGAVYLLLGLFGLMGKKNG